MRLTLDTRSVHDYATFLKVKSLPTYRFQGHDAIFPDEYSAVIDGTAVAAVDAVDSEPMPSWMFDYQRDITTTALRKHKFCVFADCGLGKTAIVLEYVRRVRRLIGNRKILIVSPLMVIPQTMGEAERFYGSELGIVQVHAAGLPRWLASDGCGIGITNYEAMTDELEAGNLGCLVLDESSMLKSHYGKWGTTCLRLGRGLEWKLACTGTPAPNDRIEYANHAVLMDAFPTVNSFLARFFVNRGQTQERWCLKHHALGPFYRALSHWCIFLTNPATYGWKDNAADLPEIKIHMHHLDMTDEQRECVFDETGALFAHQAGGITKRSVMGQLAKGKYRGERVETPKPEFIRKLIASWPTESTLVWCIYNDEQDRLAEIMPEAANISGATPLEKRMTMIADFQSGRVKTLISKPKILGFGLNLQIATRQVFSGLQDSYESFYQAVKRSNRIGSTKPLNVHIPLTDLELPMVNNVLQKSARVHADTLEQERIFREHNIAI